jgi:hypothetical protein
VLILIPVAFGKAQGKQGRLKITFPLDVLSTFDDSIPICAITHQKINRPLKTLVPNDPELDLVSAIVSWLEARGEEKVSSSAIRR